MRKRIYYGAKRVIMNKVRKVLNEMTIRFVHEASNRKIEKAQWDIIDLAVQEIMEGSYYCMKNKIKLRDIVSGQNFCMAGSNHCILAKASGTNNYWRALKFYRLQHFEAAAKGFSCSPEMRSFISQTSLIWNKLYVELWRAAAQVLPIN